MLICTACNLASPVITGFLFEMLAGRGRSISQYPAFFAVFAAIYIIEPLLTRVYVRQMCAAAEKVRSQLAMPLLQGLALGFSYNHEKF